MTVFDTATYRCGIWTHLHVGLLGDSAECALRAAEVREADVFMHSFSFIIGGGLLQAALPLLYLWLAPFMCYDPPAQSHRCL